MNTCRTCKRPNCGNHAACARRAEVARAEEDRRRAAWAELSAFLYWQLRLRSGLTPREHEIELRQIRHRTPEVYAALVRIGHALAKVSVEETLFGRRT